MFQVQSEFNFTRSIDEQTASEFRLESPIGNDSEDVQEWNYYHDPRQELIQFGTDDLPAFNNANKSVRIIAYTETAIGSGATMELVKIIRSACKAIGAGTSKRQIAYYIKRFREQSKFYIFGGNGRGKKLFIRMASRIRKKGASPNYKTPRGNFSNTASGFTRKNHKLCKTAHAIIKGRKPMEGFGQKWCSNDPDWRTLQDQHWENCKVEFDSSKLFNAVYGLLRKRLHRNQIISEYLELLRKWHGIANDNGSTMLNRWSPDGLINEWKEAHQIR